MLESLDDIPWADLEHAYGSAADVPALVRRLLDPDEKVRSDVMWTLYGNVFHQGTRFQATAYVVPFLIELCASPAVPDRGELLDFWGHLIAGYFNVLERPTWGDGEHLYECGDAIPEPDVSYWGDYPEVLHHVYRESVKGHEAVCSLLADDEPGVRAGAAYVLACLQTRATASTEKLQARLRVEPSGWVRAAIAFALGELGASIQLRRLLAEDSFPAVRCMAACELARIDPNEALAEPLLEFVSVPIEGYRNIPGAGGESTGDAASSFAYLPREVQRRAIPAICKQLDQARSFDTIPLVTALLEAAFPSQRDPVTELTSLQQDVLTRLVDTEELWSIANLGGTFGSRGLPHDRKKCAQLVGVRVANDEALASLRAGLAFAEIGFPEKACERILEALDHDPAVFERAPRPEECWFLCAKAFAESDPDRAIAAYQNATSLSPDLAFRVGPTWPLADLLRERGLT